MSNDPLAEFHGKKYVNLETFRRDGRGVKTPLWFVESDGAIFVRTPDNSGKVRRIRNNPRVRIALSDARGKPQGAWLDVNAEFISGPRADEVNELLKRKYGLLKKLIDIGSKLRGNRSVVIALRPSSR